MLAPWKKSYGQSRQHIKKQKYYFAKKGPFSQTYGFSSMWELNYKESWMLKNWYFWTVVLENTLESPLDCKEIQPVHPKGNQSSIFIGRTEAKAEIQYFGHLMWRTDSLEKSLRLGKFEGRRRMGLQRMMMASLTLWTWVWASSRSWWWIGRPGVLWSMGSLRVRHIKWLNCTSQNSWNNPPTH